MKSQVLSLFLLFSFNAVFSQNNEKLESLLREGELLDKNMKEEEALEKFLEALNIDPDNHFGLWNTSLLYSKIGFRKEEDDDKIKYFRIGKEYAKKALNIKPNDAESNFVMAVAAGREAEISSPSARVVAARDVKKYADSAVESNPDHDGAWHVKAKWNYRAANLNFFEELAANLLFGGGFEEASNEKSVAAFKKAIALDPGNVLYHLDFAIEYVEINEEEKAIELLKKALTLKPEYYDDAMYLEQCKALLSDLE